jgi:hypothetical protein
MHLDRCGKSVRTDRDSGASLLRVFEAKTSAAAASFPRMTLHRMLGGTRRLYGAFVTSVAKCPRRCSQASNSKLGRPASMQITKNHTQPVDSAMKPAPDER